MPLTVEEALAFYRAKLENKFALFKPYEKQKAFFNLAKRERLFMAGNQNGKTYAGAYEDVCHLTGRYPDWWQGKRFTKPVLLWVGGLSGIAVRDGVQTKLLGTPGDPSSLGTGLVPKALLVGSPVAGRSAPNAVDSFFVKHISGGNSKLVFKTYEQGAQFWQGPTVDFIHLDEEAPEDVYAEAMARLTGPGAIMTTFTPLLGYSRVVSRFLRPENPEDMADRGYVQMGLDDAEHFTAQEKAQRLAAYPSHERAARARGEPLLGEGAVFTVPEQDLRITMSMDRVPPHWKKIWGIDFGMDHPFAAVLLAFDPEEYSSVPASHLHTKPTHTEEVEVPYTQIDGEHIPNCYVLASIRMTNATPLQHADAMKRVAANVPVAWPHDGHQREKGSGEPLSDLYEAQGLNMLPSHATHEAGGYSTYAGVAMLDNAMQKRRFFVLDKPDNAKWFDEYRGYHYKDGKIVKLMDDLMSATRIGYIMRRKARTVPLGGIVARRQRPSVLRATNPWTGQPVSGM